MENGGYEIEFCVFVHDDYVSMYNNVYIYIYTDIYIYIDISKYVYMYLYIYIYTHRGYTGCERKWRAYWKRTLNIKLKLGFRGMLMIANSAPDMGACIAFPDFLNTKP